VRLGPVGGRVALYFLAAVVIVEVASTFLFLQAARFSITTLLDPSRLITTGNTGGSLVRVAAELDMAGYLLAVPLALHLRGRFKDSTAIDLWTVSGILFLVLGAAGAAILAFAGAPLIHEYAAPSTQGKHAIEAAFEIIHRVVIVAIWQVIDPLLMAAWLIPISRLASRSNARLLAAVTALIAAAGLVVALTHMVAA
jgi:hypothetical protein